jgi:rubrerythrin
MMDRKKFDEIIDFAVEREVDAIKFYHDLQQMVRFNSQRELLHEFEEMEKGHVEMLEKIRRMEISRMDIPRVQSLQISDYMVSSPPTEDMNFEDIITIAMKREETAQRLYTDMAGRMDDPQVQKLFLRLAAEEARHKLYFETMYDEEVLADN